MGNEVAKRTFDDLKVLDCGNGKVVMVMDNDTYLAIMDVLELANSEWANRRKEAELQ